MSLVLSVEATHLRNVNDQVGGLLELEKKEKDKLWFSQMLPERRKVQQEVSMMDCPDISFCHPDMSSHVFLEMETNKIKIPQYLIPSPLIRPPPLSFGIWEAEFEMENAIL